jgi:hypothetical protein
MFKQALILAAIASLFGANPSLAGADNWEYQGKASTGEGVTLNLDTINVALRSLGMEGAPNYFFSYRIGSEDVFAFTQCNGEFSTSTDGDTFQNRVKPSSNATRKMLDRVCRYHVKTVRVFSRPSNVRTEPKGQVLCTLKSKSRITTYGPYEKGDWFYTDACGTLGVIHFSQIR